MKAKLMMMAAAVAVAFGAWADTETVGDYTWTYRINGDTVEIFNGYSVAISPLPTGAVTIPSTLGGKPVTSIGIYAFFGCSGLTSVTIPDSVTSIGKGAFYDCSGLTSVTIGNGVTSIGDLAFFCSDLLSISVGSGNANYKSVNGLLLSKDGKTLIQGVKGNVTIPNGVTSIATEAFAFYSGLTSVTIPDSVTSIGECAFDGCSGLTSVTIPDSVTNIGYSAFERCSGLTSVTIPDSVTSIGYDAFRNCSGLTRVTIPNSVTNIGAYAFDNCRGLKSVTIPNSVRSIGGWAFSGCRGLTSVTIPDSVTSVGSYAFSGCSGLTSVTIPWSLLSEGCDAQISPNGWTLLSTDTDGTKEYQSASIGNSASTYMSLTLTGPYEFTFSWKVSSENNYDYLRWYLDGTEKSKISGTGGTWQTVSVSVPAGEHTIKWTYSKDGSQNSGSDCGWVRIPKITGGGVMSGLFPGSYATLQSVTLTGTTMEIPANTFEGCVALTSLDIPSTVTNVGAWAFADCASLTSVTIPVSVKQIGEGAFSGCSLLTQITMPGWFEGNLPDGVFEGCPAGMQIEYNSFVVAFNANGGSVGETTRLVAKGNAIGTLPTPTRTGYTFAGWWTDASDGTQIAASAVPNGNVTYYAHWTVNRYIVKFNANGGTGGKTVTQNYGTTIIVPNVTREGYTFTGWQPSEIPATVPASNVTYTAQWQINQYTATFNANGGTGGTTKTQDYGTSLSVPTVTRTGYTFDGWSPVVPSTMPAGNTTYTAQWKINQYTVTFNSAGGTSVSPITQNYNTTITRPANPTRTGYTFNGWSPAVPSTMPANNTTCVAQWKVNQYTVTFNANGGTGGTTKTQDYGTSLSAPTVTRTGYTFTGWSPSVPPTMPAGNTTYTAQWQANQYTVTFNANGGTGGTTKTQDYGMSLSAPTVTRTGYTFTGWSPSVPSTMPAGNKTYTAQWKINQYTVTFNANGGTGGTTKTQNYGTSLTAPTVTRTGYTFTGWSPSVPSTMPAGNTTYTAQWKINQYTVTFNANGGTDGKSGKQNYGSAIVAPTVTRTGYTFTGWQPVVLATVPASNVTYTAQWRINQYTVTFEGNGGALGDRALPRIVNTQDYGAAIVAPTVTREWFNFIGWSPAVAATVPANDVTYMAQWKRYGDSISVSKMGGKTMRELYPSDYTTMTTVVLEEGVRELPAGFFDGCAALVNLTLPASLEEFGYDDLPPRIKERLAYDENGFMMFGNWLLRYENREAVEVTIPEGIVGIGRGVFAKMFYLEIVTMPESLRYVASGAFEKSSLIHETSFPSALLYVGPTAFRGCKSLLLALFADGLLNIGTNAFEDCKSIKSVRIPSTVTNVGDYAFSGCGRITGVTVPTHIKTLQVLFPASYTKIETVEVADGETYVMDDMFAGCGALRGRAFQMDMSMIPSTVTNIGARAFQNCTSLTAFVVPDSVLSIGESVFQGCTALWNVTLSKSLTALPDYAFYGCSMLETMTVPASVGHLGKYFFSGRTVPVEGREIENVLHFLGNAPDYDPAAFAAISGNMTTKIEQRTHSWDEPESFWKPDYWPAGTTYPIEYWAPTPFDVIFHANGGRFDKTGGETSTQDQIMDTNYNLPNPEPTRPGWKFQGWWTESTGGAHVTSATRVTTPHGHTLYAHWRVDGERMTATFNANGGRPVVPDSQEYVPGDTFQELPDPTRRGYTFQGWWTEPVAVGGDRMTEATDVPAADMELFAHWQPITYYVRFNPNGGSGTMPDQSFIFDDYDALASNEFTRTGFQFAGWATAPSGEVRYYENNHVINLEEVQGKIVDLYARWAGAGYSVRFDSNGGNGFMDSQTIRVGETQNLWPCAFKRAGYNFAGWALSQVDAAAGNVAFRDGQAVRNLATSDGADVPMYAVWLSPDRTVRITFDANGGSVSPDYWNCVVDTAVEAFPTPTRPGFTFAGWRTAKTGGTRVESIASVTAAQTFYAHWTANGEVDPGDGSYTVTLSGNGGTVSGQATASFSVEVGKYTSQAGANRTVARSGYVLMGWYDTSASSGGNMVFDARGYAVNGKYWDGAYSPKVSSAKWKFAGNVTAYARWVKNPPYRVVTLDANGGTEAYAAVVVESGKYTSQAGAAGAQATRSGYALVGWFDTTNSAGGNMVFDARGYAANGVYWDGAYSPKVSAATWKYAGNVVAYARWVKSPPCRVVTFDANGGTVGNATYTAVAVEDGKATMQAGASGAKAVRGGYTLVGWYDTTNSVGGNAVFDARGYAVNGKYWDGAYDPGKTAAKWKFSGNVTAYARWAKQEQPGKYTATLVANGGTVSGQPFVSAQTEYGKYTNQAAANRSVTREGYSLVGWYDADDNMVFDARGYAVNGKYWDGAYSPKVSSAKWKYAGNVAAYARWVKTPPYRVVTFDANGGVISNAAYVAAVVEDGKATMQAAASGTKAARAGYALMGWFDTTNSVGGNMVFDARGYAVNGKYWNGAYSPKASTATWKHSGNVVAYARWVKSPQYQVVTFDANGGTETYAAAVVESGKYTSQAGASGTQAVRAGYALVGWFDTTNSAGGNMVFDARGYAVNGKYWNGAYSPKVSAATWKFAGSVTAYARWVKSPPYRVVTFDANGGAISNAAYTAIIVEDGKYAMQAGASGTKVARLGYTLAGWYDTTNSVGGNAVFDARGYAVNGKYWDGAYDPGKTSAKWKYSGNVAAYARWNPVSNKYTVTLNANGGTVSGQSSVSFQVEVGKSTSQAGANRTIARSGYLLLGWYDSEGVMVFDAKGYAVDGKYWNGSYWPNSSSATWKYAGNVTAYALWIPMSGNVRMAAYGDVDDDFGFGGFIGDAPPFFQGEFEGTFADGGGRFMLTLDEGLETAYFVTWTDDGGVACECEAAVAGDVLILITETGEVYHLVWDNGCLVATQEE